MMPLQEELEMGKAHPSVDLADSDVDYAENSDNAIKDKRRVVIDADEDEDEEASDASQGELCQLEDTRVILSD